MHICDIDKCTGCSACYNTCPRLAICMKRDNKGFVHPVIDKEKCINCRLCVKVCPENNDVPFASTDSAYLFKNGDFSIRLKSSSGGAFSVIAKNILDKKGYVFGAEFSTDFMVKHNFYQDFDGVKKFCTSKYVQSTIGDSYKKVFELLKDDEYVLFSGSPCQVAGLRSYLERCKCSTGKLLTVDFVCHGVGSPKFWDDCLHYYSRKFDSEIRSVNFRGKQRAGKLQNMSISFANGKEFNAPSTNLELFYYHFLKNYILRESCYTCKYSRQDRVSDITLADCFNAKEDNKHMIDGFGLSLLFANTEKGEGIIKNISETGNLVEVVKKDYIQPNMICPTHSPSDYVAFWTEYGSSFSNAMGVSKYYSFKNGLKRLASVVAYNLKIGK